MLFINADGCNFAHMQIQLRTIRFYDGSGDGNFTARAFKINATIYTFYERVAGAVESQQCKKIIHQADILRIDLFQIIQ